MAALLDTLTVCGDCLCWIANADDSQLDLMPTAAADAHRAHRDAGIARLEQDGARLVPDCGDDCESFHSGPCAVCGTRGFTAHTAGLIR